MTAALLVITGALVAAWALDDASEGKPRAFAEFLGGCLVFIAGVVSLVM